MGVRDMAPAEAQYAGGPGRRLTHAVKGPEDYRRLFEALTSGRGVLEAYCEVAHP